MAFNSSPCANPQSMAFDSSLSSNSRSMAPDSLSAANPQNVASDITSPSNEPKPQASKTPNVEVKTNPPKQIVTGRSKLKGVSTDVRNLLLTARDKGVSSLKSIGTKKHTPARVPIWKGKKKNSNGLTLRKVAKKLHIEDLFRPGPIPHPADTPILSKPSMLDALPTELKFKILHFIPNFASLSCLVHASPKFYHAYVAIRKKVLQKVTWIELLSRNINPFSQYDFYEIHVPCSKNGWKLLQPSLMSLIMTCRSFALQTGRTELKDLAWYPRFTINGCILLLAVQDYVGWTIGGRPGHRNGNPERMEIADRSSYNVLNFSRETMETVALVRGNATMAEFWAKSE